MPCRLRHAPSASHSGADDWRAENGRPALPRGLLGGIARCLAGCATLGGGAPGFHVGVVTSRSSGQSRRRDCSDGQRKSWALRGEGIRHTRPPMSGAAPDRPVRIVLMHNQRLFASALHAKLEQDSRFEIVAVASDSDDAVRLAGEVEPDLVRLDAECHTAETLSATRVIAAAERAPRVLILTGAEDSLDEITANDAGAAAFLRRPRAAADLLETLELATVLIGATMDAPDEPATQ